ncbi:MAG: ADP-ribosylglycohydrolase family protein, partial [Verrucomicrobiota bacterium]
MSDHSERLARSLDTLRGLSVGDALGESLSYRFYDVRQGLDFSLFEDGGLSYTDDTAMAITIVESLNLMRTIDEEALAYRFARGYRAEPDRGYGRMARRILEEISLGEDWKKVSSAAFGGGSFGNGAAMRVAPLGAYFADEPDRIRPTAEASARVTHFHPEGMAGAVAVAAAAGAAWRNRTQNLAAAADQIWESAMSELDPSLQLTRELKRAREFDPNTNPIEVAREVGNGVEISAQDTVPFCIWNAARNLDSFEEAIISTIEVGVAALAAPLSDLLA